MARFVYLKTDLDIPGNKIAQFSVGIAQEQAESEVHFVVPNVKVTVGEVYLKTFMPSETGDAYPHKVCNVCHRYLATAQFSRNQNGKDNRPIRRPSCDSCRKIIDGQKLTSKDRLEWKLRKPHLVIFECPICHKPTIPGLTSKVVLDHNHKTGQVRGWICDSCNTGIGRFKDDAVLLKRAIKFLEKD